MPTETYKVCSVNTISVDKAIECRRICRSLSWRTKIFFSFGHIYNDLCASIWFSYTLIYFQLHFKSNIAGLLILLGQVADAIATPFVGFESDRNDTNQWMCRYGKRKTWHLVGTLLVTCSIPFIFNECIECKSASDSSKLIYYSAFIVIFQFGWAAVQVGHVSLITDLTPRSAERVELNAYRQAATVASSICVYTITWLILSNKGDSTISKEDSDIFTSLVYIICAIGVPFSILFHLFVRETNSPKSLNSTRNGSAEDLIKSNIYRKRTTSFSSIDVKEDKCKVDKHYGTLTCGQPYVNSENGINCDKNIGKWSDWFKNINFYKVGFIYMMSRLFVNLTQIYTPLYLQKTLKLPKKSIAIIPFVTYISGFVWSLITRFISAKTGSKILLVIGCCFGLGSCVWNNFGSYENQAFKQWEVYGMSLLFGIGGTTMLISSLALTADLIGNNTTSSAFVFGTMSFFDKIMNGAFVLILEQINPSKHDSSDGDQDMEAPIIYYQQIVVFVSGSAVILTFLGLLSIMRTNLEKPNEEVDQINDINQNEQNQFKY